MASALARAHLFPKLCTCAASIVSMPVCIKAASWQAVHHLVRTLAELLQNGYLKQATSLAFLILLLFLQCRHAAVCRRAAWQSHSTHDISRQYQQAIRLVCVEGRPNGTASTMQPAKQSLVA